MRWSPGGGFTWGGQVHETGRFNLIHFQPPTPEQRVAMQQYVLAKAWQQFQVTAKALTEQWQTNPATRDEAFYRAVVAPLIAEYTAQGAAMANIGQLNAADTEQLFHNAPAWMELRFTEEEQRVAYLQHMLMQQ